MLRLEASGVETDRRVEWRLFSESGSLLADHEAVLEPGSWEWEAFRDLPGRWPH